MSSVSEFNKEFNQKEFDQQRKEWTEIANYHWLYFRSDNNDEDIRKEFNQMVQDYEKRWKVKW